MNIRESSPLRVVGPGEEAPRVRRTTYRPAIVMSILAVGTILYAQTIGIVDKGTSNVVSYVAVIALAIGLAIWVVRRSPFSRRTKWWLLALPTAAIAIFWGYFRLEGFDGNMHLMLRPRWEPLPDEILAKKGTEPTSEAAVDVTPSPHDYPGFLGANRDAFVPNVKLATNWDANPPRRLWRQPIGAGYSAFSVVGNAAITLEQRGPHELVTCYNLKSGKLAWSDAIEARHHDPIGGDGPCSTPTIHEGRVYAMGGTGVLRCLDAATGERIWMRNVLADVGTSYQADRKNVSWGRAGSPLVIDDLVVVPGGGPKKGKFSSLVAYDQLTGEIVWKGGQEQVSYSSPLVANFGGVRQIVIVNEANITGHDPATGNVLWEAHWDGGSSTAASTSQAVPIADDRFFVSKGYSSGGGAVFEVRLKEDGTWQTKELWHKHRVLKTKQNNVVVKGDHVYGLSDGTLQCVELATGKIVWRGDDYGHGQVLRVGDLLLIMQEWGAVALAALDPNEYREFCRFQAIEGKTWNNPALAGRLLVVRNAEEAACYELPGEE